MPWSCSRWRSAGSARRTSSPERRAGSGITRRAGRAGTQDRARNDRARVGPHRLHRLRRTARAYRAAPPALRRAAPLAVRRGVRGRHRGHQPVAGAGVDPARDLLRLAAGRAGRGTAWRRLFHRARPDRDPWAGRALPGCAPAVVGRRGRGRCRSGRPGRRGRGGDGASSGQLAAFRRRPRPRRRTAEPGAPEPARLSSARLSWAHGRWIGYLLAGGTAGALAGTFLVLVLAGCGLIELAVRGSGSRGRHRRAGRWRLRP